MAKVLEEVKKTGVAKEGETVDYPLFLIGASGWPKQLK